MKQRSEREVDGTAMTIATGKGRLLAWAEAHDARRLAIRSSPGVIATTGLVAVLAGVALAGGVVRRSRSRVLRPMRNGFLERLVRAGISAKVAIALAGPAFSIARSVWARYRAESPGRGTAAGATRGAARVPVRPVASSAEVFRPALRGAPVGGSVHRARV
jgi:hypothetical protein